MYGGLIRFCAEKAGLTADEAEEVVQETAIAMARHLPEYRYDPKVCRFKTWLLNQTSWRIKDQIRKREKLARVGGGAQKITGGPSASLSDEARTATVERVPDPAAVDLDRLFETEWRKNLLTAAMERIKAKFSSKQFQIFDLLVRKEWPAGNVAKSLGVSLASVYLTKHRIATALKKEMAKLEREMEKAVKRDA
jgi:RNA polymerase sigma-70 factor (ECF subfamily)